jgi:hypothetical protein
MRPRKPQTRLKQPISFGLQKHAAEAVVENIYAHTLGLAGYPPVFLGFSSCNPLEKPYVRPNG